MDSTIKVLLRLWYFLIGLLLSACSQNWAPVDDVTRAVKLSGTHIVQPGETLYAIGWRYHRDFKELAEANNIKPPYVIYVGQEISLVPKQEIKQPTPSVVMTSQQTTQTVMTPKSDNVTPKQTIWQWPVKGDIIGRFAQTKGIDIAGLEGDAIHAAADGRVVYSGNGLRGYGQLLIIKHNEQYLSAYAHNSTLLVKEGDSVKVGQVIAKMGRTDTNRVKLHFEIRQDGKPVDPLRYLPT